MRWINAAFRLFRPPPLLFFCSCSINSFNNRWGQEISALVFTFQAPALAFLNVACWQQPKMQHRKGHASLCAVQQRVPLSGKKGLVGVCSVVRGCSLSSFCPLSYRHGDASWSGWRSCSWLWRRFLQNGPYGFITEARLKWSIWIIAASIGCSTTCHHSSQVIKAVSVDLFLTLGSPGPYSMSQNIVKRQYKF